VKSENAADDIAAAALAILEEEGAEAVSMRRVADAVGVTPMAIYHHFPNRQALLTFVTDREFAKLAELMEAQPDEGAGEARLWRVMDWYVRYALARPHVFDHVFSQRRDDARRFPEDFRAGLSPTLNRVARIVEDAMDAGLLRRDDVWEVAMDLWAHVHGFVALFRAGRFSMDEADFRLLVRRSVGRLIDGLKP
jgi:AcrR family transcriptional regulator